LEEFQGCIFGAYLSLVDYKAKAKKFTDLTQGSLTVEQYATKFIELSWFALYLIPLEDLKERKYKRGLHPRIMN